MAISKKDIYLDFSVQDISSIICTQYDKDSRTFIFHVLDNGKIYNLNSSEHEVLFKMTKADNKKVLDICTINSDGTATFTLTEQICVYAGVFDVQLMIVSSLDQTILHTMPVKLIISKTVADNVDIESSDEFEALNHMLLKVEEDFLKSNQLVDTFEELNKTIETNENARVNAENTRKSNEDSRVSNENIRKSNEDTRKSNEANRVSSEETRKTEENTRKSNEITRISNENTRQTNEAYRENNEINRKSSETVRNENENKRIDNESIRSTNEKDRVASEITRKENETVRIDAENARQSNFATMQSDTKIALTNIKTATDNANVATSNADKATTRANTAAQNCENIVDGIGIIKESEKGKPNGVASLDENGTIPISQIPASIDEILEFKSVNNFPTTGVSGKIYVDLTTNLTYRWSGTTYTEISPSIALGETSSTAYRGDLGKIAYDHSQSTHARVDATKVEGSTKNGNILVDGKEIKVYTHDSNTSYTSGLYKLTIDENGHVTGAVEVTKSDITSLGVPSINTDTTYLPGTGLSLDGITFNHSNSISAGTSSGTATSTLVFGGKFEIPTINYDSQGHITGKGTTVLTMPSLDVDTTIGGIQESNKLITSGAVNGINIGGVNLLDNSKDLVNDNYFLVSGQLTKGDYVLTYKNKAICY